MTGEEFRKDYQLEEKITDGAVATHRARDLTGSPVLVHFLQEDVSGSRSSLLNYLPRLDSGQAGRILTLTEVDGVTVMVTEILPAFAGLEAWLKEAAGDAPIRDPGVYTRLLGNAGATGDMGETMVVGAPADEPDEAVEAAPENSGAGTPGADILETRVLGAEEMERISGNRMRPEPPQEPGAGEPSSTSAQAPPPPPTPKKETSPPPPSPGPKKTGRPGAFTMVFGEGHGLREKTAEDLPAMAETRVTPTSGQRVGGPSGPENPTPPPPPASEPHLAETRITPVSGNLTPPQEQRAAPAAAPVPQPAPPQPPKPATSSAPGTPQIQRAGMSPAVTWVLIILALVVGVVLGVVFLG